MLSARWEPILLDLKGKEKVKRDRGCVVTQRKLAVLMQALIKYQREALAVLVLQRGDRQPKLLSAGSVTTDSHSRNTACVRFQYVEHCTASHRLSRLRRILWGGRNRSMLLIYPLSPSRAPPCPLQKEKVYVKSHRFYWFNFFFFPPLDRFLNAYTFFSKQIFAIIKE